MSKKKHKQNPALPKDVPSPGPDIPEIDTVKRDKIGSPGEGARITISSEAPDEDKVRALQKEYSTVTQNKAGEDEELDRKAAARVSDFMSAWSGYHQTLHDTYARLDRLWQTKPFYRFYSGRANLAVPMAFKVIETILPKLFDAIYPHEDFFDILPQGQHDSNSLTIVKELMKHEFAANSFPLKLHQLIRDLLIYGTCILKVGWRYEKKSVFSKDLSTRTIKDPYTMMPTATEYDVSKVREVERIEDGLFINVIDPFDYYADPRVFDVDKADIVHQTIVSEDELSALEDAGIYKNVDKLLETSPVTGMPNSYKMMRQESSIDNTRKEGPKEYILYEFWGLFDINDDGRYEQCVITASQNGIPLRIQRNPYFDQTKPFLVGRLFPRTNSHYSMSIIQPLERSFYELNDTHNLMMDSKTLALTPMWLKSKRSGILNRSLVVRPMQVIEGIDISDNGIRPLVFPDLTASGINARAIIQQDIEESSGAVRLFAGQMPPADTPLGVYTSLLQEASARIRMAGIALEQQVILPLLRRMHSLNQQFTPTERVIRIQGLKGYAFKRIQPQDLLRDYDFRPIGVSQLHARYLQNTLWQIFMQVATHIAPAYPNKIDIIKALQKWSSVLGLSGIDDVFADSGSGSMMQDSAKENLLWLRGMPIEVLKSDNHAEHTDPNNPTSHVAFIQSDAFKEAEDDRKRVFLEHVNLHYRYLMEQQRSTQANMPVQRLGTMPRLPEMPDREQIL